MGDAKRLNVSFGVDLDTAEIDGIKKTLDQLRPGTVEFSAAWDQLKALRDHYIARIDGECAAYMRIAKEQLEEIFTLDG